MSPCDRSAHGHLIKAKIQPRSRFRQHLKCRRLVVPISRVASPDEDAGREDSCRTHSTATSAPQIS